MTMMMTTMTMIVDEKNVPRPHPPINPGEKRMLHQLFDADAALHAAVQASHRVRTQQLTHRDVGVQQPPPITRDGPMSWRFFFGGREEDHF